MLASRPFDLFFWKALHTWLSSVLAFISVPYHLYAAGNAARSLNPCSALANRSLAVFLAKAERSRLVKATGRCCSMVQARQLIPTCAMVLSSAFTHPACHSEKDWHVSMSLPRFGGS